MLMSLTDLTGPQRARLEAIAALKDAPVKPRAAWGLGARLYVQATICALGYDIYAQVHADGTLAEGAAKHLSAWEREIRLSGDTPVLLQDFTPRRVPERPAQLSLFD